MKIDHYHVRIVDEKNRINELIEECTYDILDVKHIDMNEFSEKLIIEAMALQSDALASNLSPHDYVMKHFGIE